MHKNSASNSDVDAAKIIIVFVLVGIQLAVYVLYNLARAFLTREYSAWIQVTIGQVFSILVPLLSLLVMDLDDLLSYIPSIYMIPGLLAVVPLSICILYPSHYLFALSVAFFGLADGFDMFLFLPCLHAHQKVQLPSWAYLMPLRHAVWWFAQKKVRMSRKSNINDGSTLIGMDVPKGYSKVDDDIV